MRQLWPWLYLLVLVLLLCAAPNCLYGARGILHLYQRATVALDGPLGHRFCVGGTCMRSSRCSGIHYHRARERACGTHSGSALGTLGRVLGARCVDSVWGHLHNLLATLHFGL